MTTKDKNTITVCFMLCFIFSCIDYNAIQSIEVVKNEKITTFGDMKKWYI